MHAVLQPQQRRDRQTARETQRQGERRAELGSERARAAAAHRALCPGCLREVSDRTRELGPGTLSSSPLQSSSAPEPLHLRAGGNTGLGNSRAFLRLTRDLPSAEPRLGAGLELGAGLRLCMSGPTQGREGSSGSGEGLGPLPWSEGNVVLVAAGCQHAWGHHSGEAAPARAACRDGGGHTSSGWARLTTGLTVRGCETDHVTSHRKLLSQQMNVTGAQVKPSPRRTGFPLG